MGTFENSCAPLMNLLYRIKVQIQARTVPGKLHMQLVLDVLNIMARMTGLFLQASSQQPEIQKCVISCTLYSRLSIAMCSGVECNDGHLSGTPSNPVILEFWHYVPLTRRKLIFMNQM
jgi:hypothetical protein